MLGLIVVCCCLSGCVGTQMETDDIPAESVFPTVTPVATEQAEPTAIPTPQPTAQQSYNYQQHLGTWYYTAYSSPKYSDYNPLTIVEKGNNQAEIRWVDGKVEQITFISDYVAHGDTAVIEQCAVEVPSGISEQRQNVPVVNVYDFTPIKGRENMLVCKRTTDTDRLVIAQWQSAVRDIGEVMQIPVTTLSEEEAKEALKNWIGDLGTWVSGRENVLFFDGTYTCNGKQYYQFALNGFVYDHYSTLTFFVISVDGTEMFEGQCSQGYLNRF